MGQIHKQSKGLCGRSLRHLGTVSTKVFASSDVQVQRGPEMQLLRSLERKLQSNNLTATCAIDHHTSISGRLNFQRNTLLLLLSNNGAFSPNSTQERHRCVCLSKNPRSPMHIKHTPFQGLCHPLKGAVWFHDHTINSTNLFP